MTTVIDERVVEMRFNNADFEKNVAQSMNTLDSLKKSLNFDSAKSLEELGKASKGFSLSGITETITQATSKFSALEIAGITAIAKITSAAMDMGTKLVKSLSVDQVTMGFDKYALKTQAVQTIIAATGESIENVTEQINKLNWFTDETSYNLVDMTDNIAKFTSNGIKLNDAVTQMMGIANAAALAGSGTQLASHAMEGFSKAIAQGKMDRRNWQWVKTARLDTMQFKQTLIDAAEASGTLTKVSDGVYQTMAKNIVTVTDFETAMKDGWMTTKVMSKALEDYGGFAVKLNDTFERLRQSQSDLTTSELLDYIDEYKNGVLDLEETAEYLNISTEDLESTMKDLSADAMELGNKAFKAGQEAKTFGEAIDAVKDAVSTGWMNTFELIFGNYEQAKKLWTGLANTMWDVFASGGDRRNETLRLWKERNSLIEAFVNLLNVVIGPLNAVREAWYSMFADQASERAKTLDRLTRSFKSFTEKLVPSQKVLNNIYLTFQGIFSAGKLVASVFVSIVKAIIPAAKPFGSLLEMFTTFTAYAGAFITVIAEYAEEMGIFKAITQALVNSFKSVINILKILGGVFVGSVYIGAQKLVNAIDKLLKSTKDFVKNSKTIQDVLAKITKGFEFLKKMIFGVEKPVENVTKVVKMSEKYFSEASVSGAKFGVVTRDIGTESNKALTPLQKLGNVIKLVATVLGAAGIAIGSAIVTLFSKIGKFFNGIKERFVEANKDSTTFFDYLKSIFTVFGDLLKEAGEKIKKFLEGLGIDTSKITRAFDTIGGALSNLISKLTPGRVLAIALSVALLSLVGAAIDVADKFKGMATAISGVFTNINKILKKHISKSSMITDIAQAFSMIAGSLVALSLVDQTKLKNAAIVMGIFTAAFAALTATTAALTKKFATANFRKNFAVMSKSILTLSASMVVLASSLAILSLIDVGNAKEAVAKVAMALTLLGGVVAAAIAFSKYVAVVPRGTILLLTLSVAMRQLVKALIDFSSIPYDEVDKHWTGYVSMFGGLALVIAAAGKITFGGAVGIILLAKAMQMIIPSIKEIVNEVSKLPVAEMFDSALDKLERNKAFIASTAVFISSMYVMGAYLKSRANPARIGSIFGGIGGTIAALGVSFSLITLSIKSLNKTVEGMSAGKAAKVIATCIGIIGAIVSFFGALIVLGKYDVTGTLDRNFRSMAVAMVSLGASFILMSKAVDIISKANMNGLAMANITMIGLGALLATVLYTAGKVEKAIPAMTSMLMATIAMGVLIGELAVVSILVDSPNILPALGIMTVIVGELCGIMIAMNKIKDVKTIPAIALATSLVAIGGTLVALSLIDFKQVLAAAGSMSAVMLVLGKMMDTMSRISSGAANFIKVFEVVSMMVAVGFMLSKVAEQPWNQVLAAGTAMAVSVMSMATALKVLGDINPTGCLAVASSLLIVAVSMAAVGATLRLLEGIDWGTFGIFAASVVLLAGVSAALAIVSAKMPEFGVALEAVGVAMLMAAGSFLIASVAFNVFAMALPALADGIHALVPALKELAEVPLAKLALNLLAFGAVGAGLGIVSALLIQGAVAIAVFSAATIALAAALVILGEAFKTFTQGITYFGKGVGNALNSVKKSIGNFFGDVASAFKSGGNNAVGAATGFGKKLGGSKQSGSGIAGGMATALGWHSPPTLITVGLMGDIARAFSQNGTAVSSASASGAQIGNSFGQSLLSRVSSWMANAKTVMSGGLGKIGIKFAGTTDNVSKSLSTASAQAEKFGKSADGASEKLGFFDRISQKVNDTLGVGDDLYDSLADSTDFLSEETESLMNNMMDGIGAADGFGDALEGAGGKAGKAGKDLKSFNDTLKDTISNQLDIFSKFELKQEVTADTMLQNMKSNIDGFASWSHRLAVLSERGIDQALYQKLAEMGPKGYETVAAFVQMTDAQLKEANDLFAQSMTLPESQAAIVQAGFTYAGEMASKGFSDALNDHKAAHDAAHGMGVAAIKGVDEALQIHSPSRVMKDKGWYSQMGFRDGLRAGQAITLSVITTMCHEIIEAFSSELSPDKFEEIGSGVLTNLFANMLTTGENEPNPIVTALAKGLTTFDIIDGAITEFVNHVKQTFNTQFGVSENGMSTWFYNFGTLSIIDSLIKAISLNEPLLIAQLMTLGASIVKTITGPFDKDGNDLPKIAYNVGKNVALGLRDGINEYAEEAISAARAMAESVIAILSSIPDVHSPSRVTRKIGGFISQGYALGITDGADNVYRAAKSVANSAIDGINSGRLQDIINNEFDFNPVITPILDLSYVKEQLNELSSLIAIPVNSTIGQNEGNIAGKSSPSQINFTQNNYSPKSLSRYEIYRQTKNQISQLKGVMA